MHVKTPSQQTAEGALLWEPSERATRSNMGRYMRWLRRTGDATSPATAISGAGPSAIWRGSGPLSGISSRSGRIGHRRDACWRACACPAHSGSPGPS